MGTSPLWTDARWGGGMLKRGVFQEDAAGGSICNPGQSLCRGRGCVLEGEGQQRGERGAWGWGGVVERDPSPLKGGPCQGGPRQPPSPYEGLWDLVLLGEAGKGFLWGAFQFHRGEKESKATSRSRLKETRL